MNGVVITGVGVVSALGLDPAELHERLCRGETAAGPIVGFDTSPFPVQHGCQIKGFQGRDWVENRKNLKLMAPAVQYGLAAIKLAVLNAGLTPGSTLPERLGMFVGAGTAFGEMGELLPALAKATSEGHFDSRRFAEEGMPLVNPLWLLKGLSNNVLGYASALLDAQGINQNYCNSGIGAIQAIGEAAWALLEDRADVIIAGAADAAVNPEHLTGFGRLGFLTEQPQGRPFDRRHDGFLLGEGAAFFVLERAAHAAARGARPFARIAGVGSTTSVKGPGQADADAIFAAARQVLHEAEWSPGDVDVVHAHGRGTLNYDGCEAEAYRRLFESHSPCITTDKGNLGHSMAAAGALATVVALQSQRAGRIPPIGGLEEPAENTHGLDLVVGTPRERAPRRSLVHAAGVGGQCGYLAIESLLPSSPEGE